jgi:putative membrane protein insertion efficiency factor
MKKVLISIINLYQKIPLSSHNYCRFQPTCSEYAKISINTYGSIKGSFLAIKRILRCNPFGSYGYDPVPIKEELNEKN